MNTFKRSDKPAHKLYGSSIERREFITNKEFALEVSGDSVELNPSFSDLQNSFFSRESSKIDKDLMDQLKEFGKQKKEKSKLANAQEEIFVARKNKEEDTDYTAKPIFMKLEREELRRGWLCQSCVLNENETNKGFCLIF